MGGSLSEPGTNIDSGFFITRMYEDLNVQNMLWSKLRFRIPHVSFQQINTGAQHVDDAWIASYFLRASCIQIVFDIIFPSDLAFGLEETGRSIKMLHANVAVVRDSVIIRPHQPNLMFSIDQAPWPAICRCAPFCRPL